MLCARYSLFLSSRRRKNSNVFGFFSMSKRAVLQTDLEQQSSSVGWLASYRDGRNKSWTRSESTWEPRAVLPAQADDAFCSVIFDGVLYNRADLTDYSRKFHPLNGK